MQNCAWRKSLFTMLLIEVCHLTGVSAFGQLKASRTVGQVEGQQHSLIRGATGRVPNTGANITTTVKTDSSDEYVVNPLPSANYSASADAQGFEATVKLGTKLTVGQPVEVDSDLVVGAMNTRAEVNTTGITPYTESGALELTVSNQQVVDLPLNGRLFNRLANLSHGVAPSPATGDTRDVRREELNGNLIDGINAQETDFLLNGADITEHHEGGTYTRMSSL